MTEFRTQKGCAKEARAYWREFSKRFLNKPKKSIDFFVEERKQFFNYLGHTAIALATHP